MVKEFEVANAVELWDVQQIMTLKASYALHVDELCSRDRQAAAALIGLYTDDAVVDFTQLTGHVLCGHAEISRFFLDIIAPAVSWTWHSITNPIIDVHGQDATGLWLVHALATGAAAPQGPMQTTIGRYSDRYRRTAGGWKFSHQLFTNETPGRPQAVS